MPTHLSQHVVSEVCAVTHSVTLVAVKPRWSSGELTNEVSHSCNDNTERS